MTLSKQDLGNFVRLIGALDPWLKDLVIIGGWAYRLYRFHPMAQQLAYPPVITLDTDIVLPARLPAKEPDIRQRLLESGFEEELLGDHQPPVTHYRLGGETSSFYAEFLTPLIGSVQKRNKKADSTIRVAGVTSQRLRYLEILLHSPWSITLDETKGFPVGRPTVVRIANPVSYIAHKLLIQSRRPPNERAKDILYIHDTIEVFGGSLDRLREEWQGKIRQHLHRNNLRMIETVIDSQFLHVTDVVREAALMAAGRTLSPQQIISVCQAGLTRIFKKSA
jgi:hypothetical protein